MNEKAIKAQIVRQLPAEAFQPCPAASWLLLPIMIVLGAGHVLLLYFTPVWYVALPLALLVGSTQLTLWSFAHEAAHGTMVRHKGFRRLCTNLAGFCYLYPGELLERWHLAHHRHTNQPGLDPDIVTVEQMDSARYRWVRALVHLRILNNAVYMLCANSLHAHVVLWIRTEELRVFANGSWRRLRWHAVVILGTWLMLCVGAGMQGTWWGFVLPWLVANVLWSSYALTNHQTSPLTDESDLLSTTVSLRTWRIFELLHLNGSHHLEHHLFPRMNWRYLPLVREALEQIAGERYRTVSHFSAVAIHLATPLLYLDSHTKTDLAGRQIVHLEC